MAKAVGRYNVLRDVVESNDDNYVTLNPHAIVAVIRLGLPISFSRVTMSSVTKDVTQGALLRSLQPMVITDDITSLQTQAGKQSHLKSMNVVLKSSDTNYLNEILPGDWVFAWLVSSKVKFEDLIKRINAGQACNKFDDGLKHVGRVHSIRKQINIDGSTGAKVVNYTVQCSGFSEMEAMMFYDNTLASADQRDGNIGSWLARLGLKIEDLFGQTTKDGIKPDNCNVIVPTLIDLIIGKGPPAGKNSAPIVQGANGEDVSALPATLSEPPFAYLIPVMAAQLLGVPPSEASKSSHVTSYSDILELLQGVQNYSNTSGIGMFVPDFAENKSTPQRRFCSIPVKGTYLPYMLSFTNKPLFELLKQYSNPTINEMYTALRVNPEGLIMPTLVFRQIPFTTDALPETRNLPVTRFLSLPRWVIPDVMIESLDVGRSDATRTNFVSVYGASSLIQNNIQVQYQLIQNEPIRDDLDIQRSNLRPYIAVVDAWLDSQVGKAPGEWIRLVADRMMNSQLTLNGSLHCYGIQSCIAEGDNIEVSDVVFHIESISHSFSINPMGEKNFRTNITMTNGMRASVPENAAPGFPIYSGFLQKDFTHFDPGLTLEHQGTTGGASSPEGIVDDRASNSDTNQTTPLNNDDPTQPPRQFGDFDFKGD